MKVILASIIIGLVLVGGTGVAIMMPSMQLGTTTTETPTVPGATTVGAQSLIVGSPSWHFLSFNYSGIEVKFVPYETFPVTVYSTESLDVSLGSSPAPPGVWIHYASNAIQTGPQGTVTQLIVAGAVEPFTGSGDFNITLTSSASPTTTTVLQLAKIGIPLTIVSSEYGGFLPPSIAVPANASEPYVFGIVYAPNGTSNQVSEANLEVLGVSVNGSIRALPPWLKLTFSSDSLSLNPNLPTYVALDEENSASPPHTITMTLAIAETIGNTSYTQFITLAIYPEIQT